MAVSEQKSSEPFRLKRIHFACMAFVSIVYFADIFLKAEEKCYWFDELCTVYLCRLPSFKMLWTAVLHGADFNPPLFYLTIRGSQQLFGQGLIATRLPAIMGVWLFGLCLFLFVSRHTDAICGFIAGAFPFFTLAQYYAYEARAHGLILGWCGLALLCWQRSVEGRGKNLWLVGFGLSLLGALLTHVYAVYMFVPFATVELYSLLKGRRPNWAILCAMLLVFVPVVAIVYLPLFRAYRTTVAADFFVPPHKMLQAFLVSALGPALSILLLSVILFGLESFRRSGAATAIVEVPSREIVVAASFTCIPLLGFLGSRLSHGPFLDRYFLTSIAGLAIFLGFAHAHRRAGSWAAKALAACILLFMIGDLGATAYLIAGSHKIDLVEPSSRVDVNTTPSRPMLRYETVSLDRNGLDILVLQGLDYFYFFEYAPRSVVPHLYFAAPVGDVLLGLYQRIGEWGHVGFKTVAFGSFLASHERFLVYASGSVSDPYAVQAIAGRGYRLTSAQADSGGIMYEFAK